MLSFGARIAFLLISLGLHLALLVVIVPRFEPIGERATATITIVDLRLFNEAAQEAAQVAEIADDIRRKEERGTFEETELAAPATADRRGSDRLVPENLARATQRMAADRAPSRPRRQDGATDTGAKRADERAPIAASQQAADRASEVDLAVLAPETLPSSTELVDQMISTFLARLKTGVRGNPWQSAQRSDPAPFAEIAAAAMSERLDAKAARPADKRQEVEIASAEPTKRRFDRKRTERGPTDETNRSVTTERASALDLALMSDRQNATTATKIASALAPIPPADQADRQMPTKATTTSAEATQRQVDAIEATAFTKTARANPPAKRSIALRLFAPPAAASVPFSAAQIDAASLARPIFETTASSALYLVKNQSTPTAPILRQARKKPQRVVVDLLSTSAIKTSTARQSAIARKPSERARKLPVAEPDLTALLQREPVQREPVQGEPAITQVAAISSRSDFAVATRAPLLKTHQAAFSPIAPARKIPEKALIRRDIELADLGDLLAISAGRDCVVSNAQCSALAALTAIQSSGGLLLEIDLETNVITDRQDLTGWIRHLTAKPLGRPEAPTTDHAPLALLLLVVNADGVVQDIQDWNVQDRDVQNRHFQSQSDQKRDGPRSSIGSLHLRKANRQDGSAAIPFSIPRTALPMSQRGTALLIALSVVDDIDFAGSNLLNEIEDGLVEDTAAFLSAIQQTAAQTPGSLALTLTSFEIL